MALSSPLCHSQVPLKIDRQMLFGRHCCNIRMCLNSGLHMNFELLRQQTSKMAGSSSKTNNGKFIPNRRIQRVNASWLSSSQIASSVFTIGTAAVLPFYTLMVVAPKAELTKKSIESSIPYVFLGILYAYLLYLSWTPDTIRLMFASKYWLPELSGIAKMFSSEMTLASAWIHLLAVDLFAARQVYQDGVENNIETRHSVSLCLLFCPVGILSHFITKSFAERSEKIGSRNIH